MKVLIISHLPIMDFGSMGKTFKSLFSCFTPSEICQLYIYPTLPSNQMCSSYFRVTDKDILRSFYQLKVNSNVYRDVKNTDDIIDFFENATDKKIYEKNRKKTSGRVLLRDLMWSLAPWYNRELQKWLEDEKPTCIFVAPGEAKFLYNIAIAISNRLNIPMAMYVFDEHYFLKPPKRLIDKLQLSLLQTTIRKTINNCNHIIAICDEIKHQYEDYFCVPVTTIMTGADYQPIYEVNSENRADSITFMGTLSCNRHVSIAELGKAIDTINKENGTSYALNIYTDYNNRNVLEQLNKNQCLNIHGYVSGEKFKEILTSNTIQLHTEAFDEKCIDMVKHSISTKIANCLAVSRQFMAYGPSSVASISYLKENNAAFVCDTQNELDGFLRKIFQQDECQIAKYRNNARRLAEENHNTLSNSTRLHDILENL